MMGIFSKRMNKEGAIGGMLAGIGVTLFYVFQHKGIMFIPGTAFLGDMGPNWFMGIEPNAFGAVGALVNFAVAIARVADDSAATGAHPAPGGRHPCAQGCGHGGRPLNNTKKAVKRWASLR